jgi:glycosyltransferase involved in cell wall biosynthesis
LFRRALRNPALAFVGSVDPFLASAINHNKVVHCPDPCDAPILNDAITTRKAYGIRAETFVIIVFGHLDRRKCIDLLIESVARLAPDLDVTVFLAGVQKEEDIGPVLNSPSARDLRERGRLVEANRFIDLDRDIDPMNAADLTWVFYDPSFVASSGVLVQSAFFHLPVIARRQGVIGRLVEDGACGLTLSTDSPDEIAAALTGLARDPALRQRMGENGARAFAQNTPDGFARPVVDGINRALAGVGRLTSEHGSRP